MKGVIWVRKKKISSDRRGKKNLGRKKWMSAHLLSCKFRSAKKKIFKESQWLPYFLYINLKGKPFRYIFWLSNHGKPRGFPGFPILAPLKLVKWMENGLAIYFGVKFECNQDTCFYFPLISLVVMQILLLRATTVYLNLKSQSRGCP